MSLIMQLKRELKLRQDCVQADFDRLVLTGTDPVALERIIEHSLQIGICMDKLNNIKINEVLNGTDS